jgi:hypothetical protein
MHGECVVQGAAHPVTGRRALATAVAALLLGAVGTTGAPGGTTGGRQPLSNVALAGFFNQAKWQGVMSITIAPDGPRIQRISGILPGTCREKKTGRVVRAGPDGAIGMNFDAQPNAAIRPNGTFSFTAKSPNSGFAPHTITVRGTFYGNNVLGRVRGRSTAAKYDRYSSCSGDQPFWAKRLG